MARTQQDRSKATKGALIAAARPLFAERGYAQVSADEIVVVAGLTRGALHHHFKDKHGLFRAVFEEVEREVTAEVEAKVAAAPDVATGMAVALGSFLDACRRPEVLRISLLDAPTVLGWETWRAIEAEHGLGLITSLLEQGTAAGVLIEQPSAVVARFVLSAVIEAALMIAHAADAEAARALAEESLAALLTGLFVR